MSEITDAGSALGTATVQQPADRSGPFRLRAMALACFAAPWGFLIANLGYAWATRNGGSDQNGVETLALAASHPGLMRAAVLAALLGCLLVIPAALGGMRLTRSRSPRLGIVGGSLMIAGYVCYFGVNTTSSDAFAMVEIGGNTEIFAKVLDTSQSDAWGMWIFLLFVAGNLIGTAIFGAGMLVSRAIPLWAGIGVLAWPVLHVVGLVAGAEWFEVSGAALQMIGFAGIGTALWRGARIGIPVA